VRGRGEHYLLRPLLLAGISVLAVNSLAIYILVLIPLSIFGCDSVFLPFSLVSFLAGLRVRFPLSGFFSLDSLCVV
jgi:hypothetical protein